MSVQDLIKNAQDAQFAAYQQRKERIAALQQRAEDAPKEALGSTWDELSPYAQPCGENEGDEQHYTLLWLVSNDDLKLAPFYVKSAANQYGTTVELSVSKHGRATPTSQIGAFLAERQNAYPNHRDAVLAERCRAHAEKLSYAGYNYARSREEARDALDKLNTIWPTRRIDWSKMFSTWLDGYEANCKREAKQQEGLCKREKERAAFAAAWEKHHTAYLDIVERNRAKLAALQAELDTPYKVQKLTYALVVEGEEDRHITTRTAWVKTWEYMVDDPEHFEVVHCGNIEGRKFFHPVSLDDPIALVPTLGHCTAGKVQVTEARDCLYHAPGLENVQARIDKLGLETLPAPPNAPDWMNSYDIQLITGGEDAIPY